MSDDAKRKMVVAYLSKGRILRCPDPDGLGIGANNDYPHGLVEEEDLKP